jgi:hypothetical protein
MRWVAVLLCLTIACKKKEAEPEPAAAPTAPSVGHSKTELKDDPGDHGGGGGHSKTAEGPGDAGEVADARLYGGDGSPAFRDERGAVHGPGGRIFMGRGVDCTDKIDHCLREGVWFAAGNVVAGKLYRATPVFEFEGKWWNFNEQESTDHKVLLKTKTVESPAELVPGSAVIWLVAANSSAKWLNSEHDALTSSRWDAGVIKSVGSETFEVQGWPSPIPIDTARVVIERK